MTLQGDNSSQTVRWGVHAGSSLLNVTQQRCDSSSPSFFSTCGLPPYTFNCSSSIGGMSESTQGNTSKCCAVCRSVIQVHATPASTRTSLSGSLALLIP